MTYMKRHWRWLYRRNLIKYLVIVDEIELLLRYEISKPLAEVYIKTTEISTMGLCWEYN